MFENCKTSKASNKRYEIDTADTEASSGYKGLMKTPIKGSRSNSSLLIHNEYLNKSHMRLKPHQRLRNGRNQDVNKSASIGKDEGVLSLRLNTSSVNNLALPKIKK